MQMAVKEFVTVFVSIASFLWEYYSYGCVNETPPVIETPLPGFNTDSLLDFYIFIL
jgi:hypothetical protein